MYVCVCASLRAWSVMGSEKKKNCWCTANVKISEEHLPYILISSYNLV